MTNKNFVKEVNMKVEFLELSQKAFTKMKQFWKLLSVSENSILLKGLTRSDTKSSKIAGLSKMFFA